MRHVRKLLFMLGAPLLITGGFFLYRQIETSGCKKASALLIETYQPAGFAALQRSNKVDEVTDELCKAILW